MDITDPAMTTAVDDLRHKQARRARWSRIGGGLLFAAFAIRAAAWLLTPAEAQACDATEIQSALTDLVNQAVKKTGSSAIVATLDRIQTTADDSKLRRCTSHVVLNDKSDGVLTYHVDPKTVVIDTLK